MSKHRWRGVIENPEQRRVKGVTAEVNDENHLRGMEVGVVCVCVCACVRVGLRLYVLCVVQSNI